MAPTTLTFRILRCKPGFIDPPKFQEFDVLVTPDTSVLDALEKIRLEQDSALMFRHSCHHSSCGTCACKINGKERLTCVTRALALQTPIVTLEPLDGFRVEGDLVVDMTGFYRDISEDWSYLRPCERQEQQVLPNGVHALTRFEDCIECGSCVSACPATHGESAFMGPAAMAALSNELTKSPQDRPALLERAHGARGESWCERAIECSRVCPTGVAPAKHILRLRNEPDAPVSQLTSHPCQGLEP